MTSDAELTYDEDGFAGLVENDKDFLVVYSVLASSQVVNDKMKTPVDVVFIYDLSNSMRISRWQIGEKNVMKGEGASTLLPPF